MPKGPFIIALLSAALFGAAAPASKPLLEAFSPQQLAGLLYLGAALGVLPFISWERSYTPPWRMDVKNIRRLLGAILFGGVLGPVLLLMGLRSASAASVSMWLNLELAATALLGWLIFKDRLGGLGWLGLAGTMAAALILSYERGAAGITAGGLVALACLCWGADNHFTALIDGITPSQSTLWKGLAAGTVNLVIGIALTGWSASLKLLLLALLVGSLAYGASIVLYITAAQRLGATRSQIVFSSAPFFGVLLAVLVLRESFSWYQGAAAGILVLSLIVLAAEKHAHEHRHERQEHEHWHRHDDQHHGHGHTDGKRPERHTHPHVHEPVTHSHPHWPDLHHRHSHPEP